MLSKHPKYAFPLSCYVFEGSSNSAHLPNFHFRAATCLVFHESHILLSCLPRHQEPIVQLGSEHGALRVFHDQLVGAHIAIRPRRECCWDRTSEMRVLLEAEGSQPSKVAERIGHL